MKARDWNAVDAHFRRAGAMKHRNTPRGGARNLSRELYDEYEEYIQSEPLAMGTLHRPNDLLELHAEHGCDDLSVAVGRCLVEGHQPDQSRECSVCGGIVS